MSERVDYTIFRVGISLPCSVPVLPGTPDTDAPISERTEKCSVNAWWAVGSCSICDIHLRKFCEVAGDDYEEILAEFRKQGVWGEIPNDTERTPWNEQRRIAPTTPERGE